MQDNPGQPEGCSGELSQGVQRYLLMPVGILFLYIIKSFITIKLFCY